MPLDFDRVQAARTRASSRDVRLARIRAHEAFDTIWQRGLLDRSAAYAWLAAAFGQDEAHMAWMTIEECQRVISLVEAKLKELTMPIPKDYDPELELERYYFRSALLRRVATTDILAFLSGHEWSYSRELKDMLCPDLSVRQVQEVLVGLEKDGLLESKIVDPPHEGRTAGVMQRKYYRLKKERT